ncbi:hypothetical protein OTK49_26775 [Vibrio coralliirubri]|uniref:hypothetical protein n=1 Tax=Vibrio coralliirubri TaxID=1516159 RepID=UPI0022846D69|nr:hypothetical protein [Vibrio coralliirubri]MCY9866146.1 hypothetical protein [Vibrio coralliirubri]
MSNKQIINKYITLTTSLLTLGLGVGLYIYVSGDRTNDFKRDIYSVTLTGKREVRSVETIDSAILTSTTISTNLKKTVAKIETINLANVDDYMSEIEPLFDSEFFKTFSANKKAESQFLLSSDVRVTSFVVTETPILVGVDINSPTPKWLFHVKGNYMREGVFSKRSDSTTFGTKTVWVTVQEAVGQNGNPAGVEIVNYEI